MKYGNPYFLFISCYSTFLLFFTVADVCVAALLHFWGHLKLWVFLWWRLLQQWLFSHINYYSFHCISMGFKLSFVSIIPSFIHSFLLAFSSCFWDFPVSVYYQVGFCCMIHLVKFHHKEINKISSVVETVEHTLSPELVSEPSTKTFLYSDKTSAVVTYVH